FFFSSRRRHTRWPRDWSSDVCSSDLGVEALLRVAVGVIRAELNALEKAFRNGVRDTKLPVRVADLARRGRIAIAAVMAHIEMPEIGRASCRERVSIRGGEAAVIRT